MIIKTPLSYMDAVTLAEDALSLDRLPPILVRARVADLLMRVDVASREQSHLPVHDETTCIVCISNREQRSAEKYEEDRAS